MALCCPMCGQPLESASLHWLVRRYKPEPEGLETAYQCCYDQRDILAELRGSNAVRIYSEPIELTQFEIAQQEFINETLDQREP